MADCYAKAVRRELQDQHWIVPVGTATSESMRNDVMVCFAVDRNMSEMEDLIECWNLLSKESECASLRRNFELQQHCFART